MRVLAFEGFGILRLGGIDGPESCDRRSRSVGLRSGRRQVGLRAAPSGDDTSACRRRDLAQRGRRVHVARHGALPPIELAEYLGLAPHIDYIDSTGVGGSCWEMFLEHAVAAIAEGQIETVLLSYGSTSRADLKRSTRNANLFFGNKGPAQFDAPFGHTLIAKHAMSARRHMHEFGTTIEQLAEIAVSARYNAGLNPLAYYRDPITIEDVQSSRMIADPFTKLHCCIRSDGGGAILLTSEERARDCRSKPIWVSEPARRSRTPR